MAKEKKTEMDYQKVQTAIAELPLEELVVLKADVDNFIKQRQKERRREIYTRMMEMAQAAGFDSAEAFIASQGKTPRSDKGVRLPPKYCNPQNTKQTWSGKGRKPGWVISHLASGGQMETLEIG
ncbi:MAG: H-NS histone family protein [Magnetococcus sp. MYC-9]